MRLSENSFWPDPDSSRGDRIKPLRPMRRGHFFETDIPCWDPDLDGSAYEVFLEYKPQLKDLLETHPKLEGRPSVRFTCVLAGRSETQIQPVIVLYCDDEKYCRIANKEIKKSDDWKYFQGRNPLFLLAMARSAPTGTALPGSDAGDIFVYTKQSSHDLFGSPIIFCRKETPLKLQSSRATMGGIILLGSKEYGLTVAHPMAENNGETPLSSEPFADPSVTEIYDFSDSDTDFNGDAQHPDMHLVTSKASESASSGPSQGTRSSDRSATGSQLEPRSTPSESQGPQSARAALPKQNFVDFQRSVGRIVYSSFANGSTGTDWALCELSEKVSENLKSVDNLNSIEQPHSLSGPLIVTQARQRIKRKQQILVLTSSRGLVKGVLSPIPSYYRASGEKKFIDVLTVELEDSLEMGDSGSWIVGAASGEWLGHVVAKEPGDKTAFVVSAIDIQADIEETLGERITLPIPESSPQLASRGVQRRLIANNNEALKLQDTGKLQEAVELLEDTYYEQAMVLGLYHRHALVTLTNLALAYRALGKYHLAERSLRACLSARRKSLGNEDSTTVQSIINLGSVLLDVCRYDEALDLFYEAYAIRQKRLGLFHPMTTQVVEDLAWLFYNRGRSGDAEQALRYLRSVLHSHRKTSLDKASPTIISATKNLAFVLLSLRRSLEAETVLVETLTAEQAKHGQIDQYKAHHLAIGILNDMDAALGAKDKGKGSQRATEEKAAPSKATKNDDGKHLGQLLPVGFERSDNRPTSNLDAISIALEPQTFASGDNDVRANRTSLAGVHISRIKEYENSLALFNDLQITAPISKKRRRREILTKNPFKFRPRVEAIPMVELVSMAHRSEDKTSRKYFKRRGDIRVSELSIDRLVGDMA